MCHGKRQITEEKNCQIKKTRKKDGLLLLMNNGSGHNQTSGERKNNKIVFQTNEKAARNKLCGRNFIKEINTWAVTLVRYSEPFLKPIRN